MTDREELHLLSGAYALNALESDEKARFEAYLLTSEETRTEVASLLDTAVLIGLSTVPVAPPTDLKARLMAQIAVTPQRAPVPVERPTLTAVLTESPEVGARQTTPQLSTQRDAASAEAVREASLGVPSRAATKAAARWYTRPASILVAVAAAVALFVGGNILGLSTGNQSQQQAAAISAIVSASDYQRPRRMSTAAARPLSSGRWV